MKKWKTFIQGPGLHEELDTYSNSTNQSVTISKYTSQSSYELDGEKVKEFYEQIISEPSSASTSSKTVSASLVSNSIGASLSTTFKKPKFQTLVQLMKLCELNSVSELEQYFTSYSDTNLDAVDQYGWTLLMTAAVSNSHDCVQLLLRLGSDVSVRDRSGLTAFQLANKNHRTDICDIIRDWVVKSQEIKGQSGSGESSGDECAEHTSFCEACGVFYKNRNRHGKSIAHLVCTTNFDGSSKTHYGIPESNKGFQLMLKTGWDRGGLGQSGEGQKFPVKTVLKRDRKGLGGDKVKKVAKITHFGSFDRTAVEEVNSRRVERTETVRKGESVRRINKERNKEINFRRDFNVTE